MTCYECMSGRVVSLPLCVACANPRDTATWYGALSVCIVVCALSAPKPAADDLSGPSTVLVVDVC